MADTLKEAEDFKPNDLETFLTEPNEQVFLLKRSDFIGRADLIRLGEEMLTVDILHLNITYQNSMMIKKDIHQCGCCKHNKIGKSDSFSWNVTNEQVRNSSSLIGYSKGYSVRAYIGTKKPSSFNSIIIYPRTT